MSTSYRYASALRTAWLVYLALLILPFLLLPVVIIMHSHAAALPRPWHEVNRWFLLTMAYLVVGVPAALFYRRHVCSAYFRGEVVAPRKYLVGMMTVWLSLEVGMILALVGCYVTELLLPGLLPALLAFMFFITLWPTGKMMVSRVGNRSDAAIYEQPR